MYKSILNNFDLEIKKILEGFNVYPRARAIQGRQAPISGPNVDGVGPLPTGFKGAGPAGIAPGNMSTILIKAPKKKKKKKIKLKQNAV